MLDQPLLRIDLRSSPLLTGSLIAIHALTLIPLWLADLGLPTFYAATAATLAHGGWTAWRHGWLGAARSLATLESGPFRQWTIELKNGERATGDVHSSTVVTGSLVVIALKRDGAPGPGTRRLMHAIVVCDMLAEEEFRRLRVMLKWSPPQPA